MTPPRPPGRHGRSPKQTPLAADQLGPADLQALIDEGALPELSPARQSRSQLSALRMIAAGRELLCDRSLDDLSIEAVCEASDTNVGSFYARFGSKQSFFATLQRLQARRSRAALQQFAAEFSAGRQSLGALCERLARLTVDSVRGDVGVIRASLQHAREGMWKPFMDTGDAWRGVLVDLVSPHIAHLPPAERPLRVLFAFEALGGVLVHATLNDPGPLPLEDDRLPIELARMLEAYLLG